MCKHQVDGAPRESADAEDIEAKVAGKGPGARRWRWIVGALAFWAALAVWVSLPLGSPRSVRHVQAAPTPYARSGANEFPFELEQFLPEITIRTKADAESAGVGMELRDGTGQSLYCPPLKAGTHTATFSVGNGFPAGRYSLHFTEDGVSGGYSVDVLADAPLTGWQKLLLFVGGLLLITAVRYGRARWRASRGHPQPDLPRRAWQFGLMSFLAAALAAYPLAHEGGHAIAMSAFGVLDWAGTDLLGVRGDPHARWTGFGESLAAWQRAIVCIAGPALPTLLAYLSFALWVSGPGKRARARRLVLDLFWTGQTALLLFGHFGFTLATMGLMMDTDLSGFTANAGRAQPVASTLIWIVAAANLLLVAILSRHALRRLRAARRPSGEYPPSVVD